MFGADVFDSRLFVVIGVSSASGWFVVLLCEELNLNFDRINRIFSGHKNNCTKNYFLRFYFEWEKRYSTRWIECEP